MVLVSVFETAPGWVELRSRYDAHLIAVYKLVPGLRWVKERKAWAAPSGALPIVQALAGESAKFMVAAKLHSPFNTPTLHPGLLTNLRPYQVEGAQRLLNNKGYLLAFDMRVGKTRTAAAAGASLLAQGLVNTLLVMYPNVARHEWKRQLKEQTGLDLLQLEGTKPMPDAEFARLVALPHLAIGLHYELTGREQEVEKLLNARGKFAVVADEVHYLKNRKAGRTKFALGLARLPGCAWRWGLTGTPMRNYPRDMWAMFDFIWPDSMGSYSKFTARYANGHMGDYGWIDDGVTNNEELAARLQSTMYRLTRRDVAQFLPKSDRSVVLCDMGAAEMKAYKKQEAVLGPQALKAMNEADSANAAAALKQLVALTTQSKVGAMLERIHEHAARGVKVVVFANYHETLRLAWAAFEEQGGLTPNPLPAKNLPAFKFPGFLAGGWVLPDKRKVAIDAWKKAPGAAVLFANIMSSGVGIDLADAEVALFVELTWVPADFLQAEARIQDVHLGKRTTPPLYEYLLVRGTVDEDMGLKLVNKVAAIEKVVGSDAETKGVGSTLRDSGLVERSALSLASTDEETVNGVLDALRSRLFGDESPDADAFGADSDNADEDADDDDEPAVEQEDGP